MPLLLRQLNELQRSEQADALLALFEFPQKFGRPHLHGGIGIRKMAPKVFECRAGLKLRLILIDTPDNLRAEFIGSHDEVRKFVRGMR